MRSRRIFGAPGKRAQKNGFEERVASLHLAPGGEDAKRFRGRGGAGCCSLCFFRRRRAPERLSGQTGQRPRKKEACRSSHHFEKARGVSRQDIVAEEETQLCPCCSRVLDSSWE